MTINSLRVSAANTADFRLLAKQKLPLQLFDYIDGGSYQETTLTNNIDAFSRYALRQKILRDVSKIDLSSQLFNKQLNMPLILGPVGLAATLKEVNNRLSKPLINITFLFAYLL